MSDGFVRAVPDEFFTDERSPVAGNFLSDNGNGPDPVNTLLILAINGFHAFGSKEPTTAMLASGALLTVNSDGSFIYDPAGAFDWLEQGENTVESFTYLSFIRTLPNGRTLTSTTTVSINIEGIADNGDSARGPFDFVLGSQCDDTLRGTELGDFIYALGGDDVILPGGGANTIEGDDGDDTVVYAGLRADYEYDLQVDSSVVVERLNGEIDALFDVERIAFDDGALIYDEPVDGQNLWTVYSFYSAGLGRTADEEGLRYWISQLDYLDKADRSEDKVQFMADSFVLSDEFGNLYDTDLNDADYVDTMYMNALGRAADEEGHAFWTDAMERGLGRDALLIAFAQCDENRDRIAPDINDGVWVM